MTTIDKFDKDKDKEKEIEEVLELVRTERKPYYLTETNINAREDLSQELDLLMYQKLQAKFNNNKETPNLIEYVLENLKIK